MYSRVDFGGYNSMLLFEWGTMTDSLAGAVSRDLSEMSRGGAKVRAQVDHCLFAVADPTAMAPNVSLIGLNEYIAYLVYLFSDP